MYKKICFGYLLESSHSKVRKGDCRKMLYYYFLVYLKTLSHLQAYELLALKGKYDLVVSQDGSGKKKSPPTSRYYPIVCMKELRRNMKTFGKTRRELQGRATKPEQEKEPRTLIFGRRNLGLFQWRSIFCFNYQVACPPLFLKWYVPTFRNR